LVRRKKMVVRYAKAPGSKTCGVRGGTRSEAPHPLDLVHVWDVRGLLGRGGTGPDTLAPGGVLWAQRCRGGGEGTPLRGDPEPPGRGGKQGAEGSVGTAYCIGRGHCKPGRPAPPLPNQPHMFDHTPPTNCALPRGAVGTATRHLHACPNAHGAPGSGAHVARTGTAPPSTLHSLHPQTNNMHYRLPCAVVSGKWQMGTLRSGSIRPWGETVGESPLPWITPNAQPRHRAAHRGHAPRWVPSQQVT
jgi:hypothetical protein